jgi:NTP pyrophosphatase (non-canonical NTP hydrolase)
MRTTALFQKAQKSWTWQCQAIKLNEELGELLQAMNKYLLKQSGSTANLAEEIADVEIMCHQIRSSLKLNKKVSRWKLMKLKRLERRLKK